MPTPTIPAGNLFMNASLYTGNGTAVTVTNGAAGASFQPDLVWGKSRSNAINNSLVDSVRGVSKSLFSNLTDAEDSAAGYYITGFNSNGFTVGLGTTLNTNGATYVGWQWKAGGTAVSNTDGTITTSISANQTSGFSVVTWAGTGASGSIGHGLGATPNMVIIKNRTSSQYWFVNHISFSATLNLYLNTTDSTVSDGVFTSRSSTTIGIGGNVSTSANNYVAYCWAPIAGYSAFGSYVGNGSDDGPFIYTGFRPKFIFRKCSSTAGENSMQYDTSMNPYNASPEWLSPNLSAASNTAGGYYIDFLSNGVKIRHSATGNNSGRTYIYMAFAENPFKYANAR